MASTPQDAYVTLLTSDGYLPGAMVLAHSLRDNGTKKQLAAMVTTDTMSADTIQELRTVYDTVIPVDRIRNRSPANLYLMNRPDLDSAFTKIHLWRLVHYRKLIYVDADVVSIRAPDELFNLPEPFSAAPDIGWPDLFNSGVMVLTPNMGDYYALSALAGRGISFDGADQGLLNMHFTNYNRIGFAYNCTPSGHYQYVPAYRHFQSTISMVHYIGENKPWRVGREFGGPSGVYQEVLGRWWATYDKHYRVPDISVASGHAPPRPRVVQKFVAGEQLLPIGYTSTPSSMLHAQTPSIHIDHPSPDTKYHEPTRTTTEEPMVESSADANYAGEPQAISAPPVQERRFSAPHAEWNPAVQPPPVDAKPEAANFPQHTYSMSADRELFQPPPSYPDPPKDMWYEVPERHPSIKPKPIFPWEENQSPPTRVFPTEPASTPRPEPHSKPRPEPIQVHSPVPSGEEFAVSPPPESLDGSTGAQTSRSTSRIFDEPQTPFSPTQVPFSEYRGSNVWDDIKGINEYVTAFQNHRKGGSQVLESKNTPDQSVLSLIGESPGPARRANLKITNFPTAFERPSLPVTPAPIRRNMFWGSERDAQGNLPEAEGVPGQNEWNPEQQIEKLRRNSLLFAEESTRPGPEAPLRSLPAFSSNVSNSAQHEAAGGRSPNEKGDAPENLLQTTVNDKSATFANSQYFGGDGAGSSGTIWVDHSSAGRVFESTSISAQQTASHTFETSQSSTASSSSGSATAFRTLNFDPSPKQEATPDTSVRIEEASSSRA